MLPEVIYGQHHPIRLQTGAGSSSLVTMVLSRKAVGVQIQQDLTEVHLHQVNVEPQLLIIQHVLHDHLINVI